MKRAIVVLALLAGCGTGEAANRAATTTRATTTSSTSTSTTTTTTTTTVPRPSDPDGVACQSVVDQAVGELRARGAMPDADAVCVNRATDPTFADGRIGSYRPGLARVAYPLASPRGYWETIWRYDAVHELGHGWDAQRLTNDQRGRYAQIRGLPAWDAENYADTFSAVIGGSTSFLHYIKVPPPSEQTTALCAEHLLPC